MIQRKLQLSFGAMSPGLNVQIASQDLKYDIDEIDHLQRDVDAMNRLRIRGYIPDGQIAKLNQKIFKKITAHVNKMNHE